MGNYGNINTPSWVIKFHKGVPQPLETIIPKSADIHLEIDGTPLLPRKQEGDPYQLLEIEALESLFRLQEACNELKNLTLREDATKMEKRKILSKVKQVEKGLGNIAKLIHVFNEILRRMIPPKETH